MKKHLWTVCFSAALAAFTVYIALDTFVLSASYDTNAVEMNTAMFEEVSADGNGGGSASPEDGARRDGASAEARDPAPAGDPGPTAGRTDSGPANGRDPQAPERTGGAGGASDEMTGSDRGDGRGGTSGETSRSGRSRGSDNADGSDRDESPSDPSERSDRSGRSGRSSRSGWSGYGNSAESAAGVDAAAAYSGDTTYRDDNVSVTLAEYNQYDTAIYVADVTVSSTEYIKAAFANDTYGKNVTESTSAMAAAHGAILAVNGDYYGAQERGYVIRNGVVYRDTAADKDVMCIYADGTMGVVSDRDFTAEQLVERGVWQAFSFGPGLIEDGAVAVTESDEVGRGMASNPRTAVGMIDTNHFVFVVSDGRTDESEGLTLYELALFMQGLGVKTAYNLDGGGSSTMYFNGQVVNNPTSSGGSIRERGVSDIVYIG